MQKLNYPSYTFKLKTNENKTLIFDIVKKICDSHSRGMGAPTYDSLPF